MPIDPVCGMTVAAEESTTADHGGTTYHFCSASCRELFAADPDGYLESPHPHLQQARGLRVARLPFGRARGDFEVTVETPGELGVGDHVRFTREVTESDVRQFAEATGDTNALHLSDEFAADSRFGRRIAHGTLVAGQISAALACVPGLSIYLSQDLAFERPVDVGATLVTTCEVEEALGDDRYRFSTRVETDGGRTVIDGTATVLIDPLPT